MPAEANEIETPAPVPESEPVRVCPTCGTRLLKSGYCPKCHRKRDGTKATRHGKHGKSGIRYEDTLAGPGPNPAITAGDYSRPPETVTEDEYLCEGCRAPVHYLQRKCKKCGIYLDWRGSPAENDPDTVICPVCGAFCGYAEDDPTMCPHCRFQG